MVVQSFKNLVRRTLNRHGHELVQSAQHPAANLMGMRGMGIRTILDIGANTGQFAAEAARWFPGVNIHSFEPIPGAFEVLRLQKLHEVSSFHAYQYALGDEEGEVEMNETVNDTTSSSMLTTTEAFTDFIPNLKAQARTKVRIRQLDHVIRSEQIPLSSEILIKLDVQGYEDRVIRGGQETFQKARACIVEVILDSFYEGQASFLGLTQQLHELGLHYAGNFGQYHLANGNVMVVDAFFTRKSSLPGGGL